MEIHAFLDEQNDRQLQLAFRKAQQGDPTRWGYEFHALANSGFQADGFDDRAGPFAVSEFLYRLVGILLSDVDNPVRSQLLAKSKRDWTRSVIRTWVSFVLAMRRLTRPMGPAPMMTT